MVVILLRGVVLMGCIIVGLFFLRFWRDSRDRFFALFALAFWALGISYIQIDIVTAASDWRPYVFIIRLIAFALILVAIAVKNR